MYYRLKAGSTLSMMSSEGLSKLNKKRNTDGLLENDSRFIYIYKTITATEEESVPSVALALEVYPVPARDRLSFEASLSEPSPFNVNVYDLLGRRVLTLVEDHRHAGVYKQEFSVSHLPPGMYMLRIESEGQVQAKPFVVVR